MVKLPGWDSSLSPQAPRTGISIPRANTAMWDTISDVATKALNEQMAELGAAEGVTAAAENPDQRVEANETWTVRGKAFQRAADEQFSVNRQLALSTETTGLTEKYAATGDVEGFKREYDSIKRKWLASIPAQMVPGFSRFADEQLIRGSNAINRARTERQRETNFAAFVDDAEKLRSSIHDSIISGADEAAVKDAMAQYATLVSSGVGQGYLDPVRAQRANSLMRETVTSAEIVKGFRDTAGLDAKAGYIQSIRTAQIGDGLDPEARYRIAGRLEAEYADLKRAEIEAENKQRASILRRFDDAVAAVQETGRGAVSEASIWAAFRSDPDRAAEMVARQRNALEFYTARTGIAFTDVAEDTAAINRIQPQPGEPDYATSLQRANAFERAIAAKRASLDRDPAAYVLGNSPELRRMAASSDPNDRRAALVMMDGLYDQLGVAAGKRRYLTKDAAEQQVADIASANPADVPARFSSMAQTYGDKWPAIYGELVKAKLPDAYQVLAVMDEPGDAVARNNLAAALQAGSEQLKSDLSKRGGSLVGEVDRAVEEQLTDWYKATRMDGDNARTQFGGRPVGGSGKRAGVVADATRQLAYYYTSRGMNADAAAKAARQDILGRYDFVDAGGTSYFVPAGTADRAVDLTRRVLDTTKPEQIAPLADPSGRLTEDQRRTATLAAARNGHWIVGPSGDTIVWVYESGMPVRRADGSVYELTYRQIAEHSLTKRPDTTTPARQRPDAYTAPAVNPITPSDVPMRYRPEAYR